MRNLARLFVARGLAVSGSDVKDSVYLTELGSLGVRIHVGHDPALLGSPDVVVVSSAIRDDNPEVAAAARSGIPIWKRQQAIGALAAGHRTIAISGAHGKTTTTSLIAATLEAAGLDPTKLIGGDLNESGSGARHGTGDLFVFEADESDGSFLMIPPWVGVITNLDADHLDFYPRGLEEIEDAFAEFAVRCDHVVAWGDAPPRAPVSAPRRMAPRPDAICSCGWTPSARWELEAPCSSTRPRSRSDSGSTGRTTS
jgi:UDP-N-acetylmuramate--alanine ligase